MNVLVVDDSEVMRGMIVKALKNSGLPITEVLQADNGVAALQCLNDGEADLVLMDLNMPVMDGETFLRTVRSRPSTAALPVVVVSSTGARQRVSAMELLGAVFVQKPFTPQTIRAAVEEAVAVRQ